MCRYDDDWEWLVESEVTDVADTKVACEDCGRTIDAGEQFVRFLTIRNEDNEAQYVFAFQYFPKTYTSPDGTTRQRFDSTKPYIKIDEDDIYVWEALGFEVFEVEDPVWEPDTDNHISCAQCRKAAKWLTVICHQHTVLVTKEDLNEHTHQYDMATLGPEFGMLVHLVNHGWRSRDHGKPLKPSTIERLTQQAIDHAIAAGLQEAESDINVVTG